jgi:hypothetical protein
MKLLNLYESLDDNQNLEIQHKTQNFYFSTRTGLKCRGGFQWPNKHTTDDLIIINAVVELSNGVIPNDIFDQVILGAFDFIKTLGIDFSDISDLEIKIGSITVSYVGLEIKMNNILTQSEKIHYSNRIKLSTLNDDENTEVFGTEILREFPRFVENLDTMVENLKSKSKNIYRAMKRGKVKEFQYELPDEPKIDIKLSMDNVRKDSTIITPNLIPYIIINKNDINILNKPEDIDDTSLNLFYQSFFHELGLKFRKFKIILTISE